MTDLYRAKVEKITHQAVERVVAVSVDVSGVIIGRSSDWNVSSIQAAHTLIHLILAGKSDGRLV